MLRRLADENPFAARPVPGLTTPGLFARWTPVGCAGQRANGYAAQPGFPRLHDSRPLPAARRNQCAPGALPRRAAPPLGRPAWASSCPVPLDALCWGIGTSTPGVNSSAPEALSRASGAPAAGKRGHSCHKAVASWNLREKRSCPGLSPDVGCPSGGMTGHSLITNQRVVVVPQ